jgi:hypothetical protein
MWGEAPIREQVLQHVLVTSSLSIAQEVWEVFAKYIEGKIPNLVRNGVCEKILHLNRQMDAHSRGAK